MPMIELPHGRVHYRVTGEGQATIVLLHANPGCLQDFDAIVGVLGRHYRVITLDWPGYGTSPAPNPVERASAPFYYEVLESFLDAIKLAGPVVLLGNSLGGFAAARYAIDHPERVRALVLVSPGGFSPRNALTDGFCTLQASRLSIPPGILARLYLHGNGLVASDMKKRAAKEQSTPSARAINRLVWRSFADPATDLREAAKAIRCPVLLFMGKYDPLIQPWLDGKNAVAAMPHAQFHIADTGHAPFAEALEYFTGITLGFLRKMLD